MRIHRLSFLVVSLAALCGCQSTVPVVEQGNEYQKLEKYYLHGHDRIISARPEVPPAVTPPQRLNAVPSHWGKTLAQGEYLSLIREYNLAQPKVNGNPDKQNDNSRRLIIGIAVKGMKESPVEQSILFLGIRNSSKPQPRFQPIPREELKKKSFTDQRKYNQLLSAYKKREALNSLVRQLLTACGGRPDEYCSRDLVLTRLRYELEGLNWKLDMETKALRGRK